MPSRSISPYMRIAVSGVLSSCDTAATKLLRRSANATADGHHAVERERARARRRRARARPRARRRSARRRVPGSGRSDEPRATDRRTARRSGAGRRSRRVAAGGRRARDVANVARRVRRERRVAERLRRAGTRRAADVEHDALPLAHAASRTTVRESSRRSRVERRAPVERRQVGRARELPVGRRRRAPALRRPSRRPCRRPPPRTSALGRASSSLPLGALRDAPC